MIMFSQIQKKIVSHFLMSKDSAASSDGSSFCSGVTFFLEIIKKYYRQTVYAIYVRVDIHGLCLSQVGTPNGFFRSLIQTIFLRPPVFDSVSIFKI
jgi:hypothetical protein